MTTGGNGKRPLNARIRDIPLPFRMKTLPISDEGYPIPWFVAWLNEDKNKYLPRGEGTPDFRIMGNVHDAHRMRLCWVCGGKRGKFGSFVIGPMCVVNRISAEPPSHLECAEYAVRACPFLSRPNMRRNERDMPPTTKETEGMIKRNPGVMAIWTTTSYTPVVVNPGTLFRMGPPHSVSWWREGRPATRDEILQSIEEGLPILRAQALKDGMIDQVPALLGRAMEVVPPPCPHPEYHTEGYLHCDYCRPKMSLG